MATTALGFQNWFSTTLSSGITASDTTIYVNSLPTPNEGYLVLEPDSVSNREVIYYTSKGANYVTCPSAALGRGVDGSTAASHSSGVTVQMNVVAAHLEALQDGSALAETVSRSNGWYAGTSTWVYASATTFTVSAAEAAFMSVGTKIWLTQTSGKYFYVTGVSGTTITVTGGSDYTVANAAITAPYFSNATTPFGFPGYLNYTYTTTNVTEGSSTKVGKFRMTGKQVHYWGRWTFGSGSAVSGSVAVSVPITVDTNFYVSGEDTDCGWAHIQDLSTGAYAAVVNIRTGTLVIAPMLSNGTYLSNSATSSTVPFAWGTGDYFSWNVTYPAA